MDLFFEVLNERIELRDVGRVVALFVLAEAEQVRDILRSPAVEVEFIFLQDELAKRFILRVDVCLRIGGYAEQSFAKEQGGALVAVVGQMHTVLSKGMINHRLSGIRIAVRMRLCWRRRDLCPQCGIDFQHTFREICEHVNEQQTARLSYAGCGFGEDFDFGIEPRRRWNWRKSWQQFMRRHKYAGDSGGSKFIQQSAQLL